MARQAPAEHAKYFANKRKIGLDRLWWISKPDKNGVFRWFRVKAKVIRSPKAKPRSPKAKPRSPKASPRTKIYPRMPKGITLSRTHYYSGKYPVLRRGSDNNLYYPTSSGYKRLVPDRHRVYVKNKLNAK